MANAFFKKYSKNQPVMPAGTSQYFYKFIMLQWHKKIPPGNFKPGGIEKSSALIFKDQAIVVFFPTY